jgi:small subunit ribosomal protein S13
MVRIIGQDIPDNRKVWFGLTKIYGIGKNNVKDLLDKTNVDGEKRVSELSSEEISKIQKTLDEDYTVEGNLQREIQDAIKRLKAIGSYRGLRHTMGQPARGQRTRSNARTKKGKRKTVGAMKKDIRAKMETS